LYLNGEQQSLTRTGTSAAVTANTTFYVGHAPNSGYSFAGTIDDVRIYSRELSQAEVLDIMHSAAWQTTAYDAAGNVASTTDPLGNTTTYRYDNLKRQIQVIDALDNPDNPSHPTVTTYDALGHVVSITDPKANTTRYEYDHLSRQIATGLDNTTGLMAAQRTAPAPAGFGESFVAGGGNLIRGIKEPFAMIADTPHVMYARLAGQDLDAFEPWSMWGDYSKQRRLQGAGAGEVFAEAAPSAAANTVTVGWYGYRILNIPMKQCIG
jgi:YD repeat-containing protein